MNRTSAVVSALIFTLGDFRGDGNLSWHLTGLGRIENGSERHAQAGTWQHDVRSIPFHIETILTCAAARTHHTRIELRVPPDVPLFTVHLSQAWKRSRVLMAFFMS